MRLVVQVSSDRCEVPRAHRGQAVASGPAERPILGSNLLASSQERGETLPAHDQTGNRAGWVRANEGMHMGRDHAQVPHLGTFVGGEPGQELGQEGGPRRIDEGQPIPGGPDDVEVDSVAHAAMWRAESRIPGSGKRTRAPKNAHGRSDVGLPQGRAGRKARPYRLGSAGSG
jgi:hypothetical protein